MSRHPRPPSRRDNDTNQTNTSRLPAAAVEAFAVAKDYAEAPALHPLTLRIEHGQRVALLGHNGSGKTTFIRMAAGLLDPTAGSVNIDGHAPSSLEARTLTSYLADTPVFYDDLSVWEHLEYVARMHGVTEWEQHAADLLDHLGLYARAEELPQRFSRGLRQKVAIAIAFIRPFELLLVDEPFVGLDAAGREALLALLAQAGSDGATLVVATHELSFVSRVERIVALRDGHLIHDGPPTDTDIDALVRTDAVG
ncbi:MAG: ABC transporter ATP-binding protein [Actinobacteria bacterium]|nr:ABC transporter ATP-binding protein [Actinomycetota bacterium]